MGLVVINGFTAAGVDGMLLGAPENLFLASLSMVNAIRAVALPVALTLLFGGLAPAPLGPLVLWSERARYSLALAVGALLAAAARNIARMRPGRALLAIRETEVAAQARGVHVATYKTLAFVLSTFYPGVAGGLFAFVVGDVSPDAFDVFVSVDLVAMIILGGLGSISGSIVGAAVITRLHDWLVASQNYPPSIFAAILIGCMLLMPGGIASRRPRWIQ